MAIHLPILQYKISEAAREIGVSVETIRMYEREGILLIQKTANGQRIFYPEDLKWLRCIRRLIKQNGLNIEGIRRILALMPCWSMRPCHENERQNCVAYKGATKPCWMLSEGIPASCKSKNCRKCAVYKSATQCENMKRIIYHNAE